MGQRITLNIPVELPVREITTINDTVQGRRTYEIIDAYDDVDVDVSELDTRRYVQVAFLDPKPDRVVPSTQLYTYVDALSVPLKVGEYVWVPTSAGRNFRARVALLGPDDPALALWISKCVARRAVIA
jgi:hypothetical protein